MTKYVKYVCYGNNECVWVIGLWIEFSEKFKISFYNGNFFKIKFSKVSPFLSHMSYVLPLCIMNMILLPQPAECWGGGLQHHDFLHTLTGKQLPRTDYPQSGAHRWCEEQAFELPINVFTWQLVSFYASVL